MNIKNNNYRVMKFLEPVNKQDKSKGYVRLDIRGIRGTIIVSVENLGDNKSTSEVYLYKDKKNKIKIGTVNNRKGMIKKTISIGNNNINFEEYNVCGVVKDNKIVLYANLFNAINSNDIRKLEETVQMESVEEDVDSLRDEINPQEEVKKQEQLDEATEEIESVIETVKTEVKQEEVVKQQELEIDVAIEHELESEEYEEIEPEIEKVEEVINIDEINTSSNVETMEFNSQDIKDEESDVEAASRKVFYKNKFEENLFTVLKDYNKLDPLSVNIKSISWWKIPYDDRGVKNGFLPFYNQIISSYYPYPMSNRVTTCHGLMRKYGYYIFGIYKENNDVKKFVYGVPGEFKRDEQPYKGVTGFKNWSYKNKEISGDYGFWLAFVDSNTGDVTEPPQIVLGK